MSNEAKVPDVHTEYAQYGVCIVRDLLPSELIQVLDQECLRLWQAQKNRSVSNLRLGLRENLQGDVILDRIDPVEDISAVFKGLNADPRLTQLAETLLEEPVAVMKEKLLYKQPGTSGFGLHRDISYFEDTGVKGKEVLTAAVAIDVMTPASGAVMFYPQLRLRETHAAADDARDVDEAEVAGLAPRSFEVQPGDVLFFDGLIPHCSDFNRSDNARRVYYITYIPARYPEGRRRYYRQRLREQARERRDLLDGECRFD